MAAEQAITATPAAAERAAEAAATAAAAPAAAEQQRQERLKEAELLQELEQEREHPASGMHTDDSPADEDTQAKVFSNDADDAIERFEQWLELLLDNQHGIVGDTATMYVSFAVALLQLEETGGSTLEQLAEVKLAALDTLFGELSSEDALSKQSNDPDGNALGAQCWGFWAREVLPRMQGPRTSCVESNNSRDCSVGTAQDGVEARRASSPEPEPELELASERRIDPSDGVAYEYASFEQVYGPLRAPELWIKAGELMKQAGASETETGGSGGAYIPPHKKGNKKGSKKGVALSLDELGFLFQGPSAGGGFGSAGLSSSSSESWSHDCYEAGRADFGRTGGRSWRSEEGMGGYSSDRLGGGSFWPRTSYSSTPRAGGSMSSMSYGGLARSSARSGGGGGTGSRDSDGSNRPSSSTEVAHRMIMHVLRSQYVLCCSREGTYPLPGSRSSRSPTYSVRLLVCV